MAELIVGRLGQLPDETQAALQTFACFGNTAKIDAFRRSLRRRRNMSTQYSGAAVRHHMVERPTALINLLTTEFRKPPIL